MKVLVIEDSTKLQTFLGAGLRAMGYAADVAADSQQAIAYASSHDYDIIILDLMLPRDASLLILHEIRESNREVEILILSTRDQIHDRVTALIQGADDYLEKPFSFDELHARIQELRQRRASHTTTIVNCEDTGKPKRYLDRLIGNLLQLCGNDLGEIELVISEVKLEQLLQRVNLTLKGLARDKKIRLRLPRGKLPTLLGDAKWMEHMLSNLVFNAISHSPLESEIRILVHDDQDRCAIVIECQVDETFELSLIKSYSTCLNLEVSSCVGDDERFRVCISNLKIV
ncbi:MAG: response regulator [Gammaproteobacteria bacterium]|nr:response regulator [Gammaproteobacteria bacterium]